MNKLFLTIPAVLCLALMSHAADPTPTTTSGEIIMEQRTRVVLGSNGRPEETISTMKVYMRAENGVTLRTREPTEWLAQKDGQSKVFSPLTAVTPEEARRLPKVEPYHHTGKPLEHAIIGKKVEDGVTIAGEWQITQYGPTNSRPIWTERLEIWYRVDKHGDGRLALRPHRKVRTSIYENETVDYHYFSTTRLHPQMFDLEP